MSKKHRPAGAVTASPPSPQSPPARTAAATPPKPVPMGASSVLGYLKLVASLKLTVVLMLLLMALVFFGTLAQVGNGVWTVVDKYFRSFVVWVPLQIFVHPTVKVPFGFPFPGGWTLGGLLLLNLVSAHIVRFQFKLSKAGMWLIHIGLIVMMLGELATGLLAIEARMIIEEGKASNVLLEPRKIELAFVDVSDPDTDRVVAVPTRMLAKGKRVSAANLPVDVECLAYYPNSSVTDGKPDPKSNLATVGFGLTHEAKEKPETSGVETEQEEEAPSAYVRLIDKKTNQPMGVWLVSMHLKNQLVTLDGKPYELILRYRQTYEPYSLHLIKFTHDKYLGTEVPKDYRSQVRVIDPERNVDREVEIYMNAPLTYRGKTFYQADFLKPNSGMKGTVLQVVTNPGWFMPYVSCILVAVGMLIHFGITLGRFLVRSRKEAEATI